MYEREPCTYQDDFLEAYQPNETYYLTKERRSKLQALGNQNITIEPAGTYAHKIYERILIDLSYHSSRLEGNMYSLLETRRLLLEGKPRTWMYSQYAGESIWFYLYSPG